MCIFRATVSAVSCLVVPAFISNDLLISFVLKINDDDDDKWWAPFGKSDHCVLLIDCNITADKTDHTEKLALSRGDYDGLRNSLQLNWHDLLIPCSDNIVDMWLAFKTEIENKISSYIPTYKSFNSWKKDSWNRPLNPQIRKMISKKEDCGHDIWKHEIQLYLQLVIGNELTPFLATANDVVFAQQIYSTLTI